MKLPEAIDGSCDARFAAVAELLAGQLASGSAPRRGDRRAPPRRARGRHLGRPGLVGATRWRCRSRRPRARRRLRCTWRWSGPASTTTHPSRRCGPSSAERQAVTIRHVLCHEAGLPQIRGEVPDVWAMADWDAMVAMMERLEPALGAGHRERLPRGELRLDGGRARPPHRRPRPPDVPRRGDRRPARPRRLLHRHARRRSTTGAVPLIGPDIDEADVLGSSCRPTRSPGARSRPTATSSSSSTAPRALDVRAGLLGRVHGPLAGRVLRDPRAGRRARRRAPAVGGDARPGD